MPLRKGEATRRRILDAAIACLVTGGYSRFSVSAVAERADLTRAALLYHFASREALVTATIAHLLDKRLELYWDAVRAVPAGPQQIGRFVDIYWEQVNGDLFVAFVELLVNARTHPLLGRLMASALDGYEAERLRYSRLIFSHEMQDRGDPAFQTIRDVARFLIEGMGSAAMLGQVAPDRIASIKAFVVAQIEAAYRSG